MVVNHASQTTAPSRREGGVELVAFQGPGRTFLDDVVVHVGPGCRVRWRKRRRAVTLECCQNQRAPAWSQEGSLVRVPVRDSLSSASIRIISSSERHPDSNTPGVK